MATSSASRAFVSANTDYISLADASSLDLGSNFSLVARIKSNDQSTYKGVITKSAGTSATIAYGLWTDTSGRLFFLTSNGTTTSSKTASTDMVDDSWHTIGASFDSGTVKLYLDGSQDGTDGTSLQTPYNNSAQVWIGGDNGFTEWVNGNLADIRLYNVTLTAAEQQEIAGGDLHSIRRGLVANIDCIRQSFEDLSGNGNTGTNNGSDSSQDGPSRVFIP